MLISIVRDVHLFKLNVHVYITKSRILKLLIYTINQFKKL